jgi:hypothetical protein
MPKLQFLDANAAAARSFSTPLPPAEMDRLRRQYAVSTVELGRFFAQHRDDGAWTVLSHPFGLENS